MIVHSFLPFGMASKEAGLVSLISNYLNAYGINIKQLLCNGVVSACQRDNLTAWKRDFNSCLQCMSEQSRFAAWSGRETFNLSKYLHPKDIDQTKRWILSLRKEELSEACFEGLPIYSIVAPGLKQQFGDLDLSNRSVETIVRRVMLSAVRISRAIKTYEMAERPDYVLLSGGSDFMTTISKICLKQKKVSVALFCYNEATNEIVVESPRNGKVSSYPLVFDDVTSFRTDARTWPPELLKTLEELIAFIDLAPNQMVLPLSA